MAWNNVIKFLVALVVSLSAGFAGSVFTTPNIPTWYAGLQKPAFTPPNWLFGPVWTVLYILMGTAAFLVWKKGLETEGVKRALLAFIIQLVFNLLWSLIFFGFHAPLGGVVIIVILWVAILYSMLLFFKISKAAGWMMLPYLVWVSYAAALNTSIWLVNP